MSHLNSFTPKLIDFFSLIAAAVKVEGGAKYVDHKLVIDLLYELVEHLKTLLYDLKLIVKDDLILSCAPQVEEIAKLIGKLLIVCIFFPKVSLVTNFH